MRYGLIPENPAEEAVLRDAPQVRVLLDPFLSLVAAHALTAFVRLDLPARLAAGPCGVAALAAAAGLEEDGLVHLLRVLTACGYVEIEGDTCRLSGLGRTTLAPEAPYPLDAWVAHNAFHGQVLAEIETALAAPGRPRREHGLPDDDAWSVYQRAMLQTALPVAQAVAGALPEPPRCATVLDLGGSHGLYGATICRRFGGERSVVLELPEALPHARAAGRGAGLENVVEYRAADLLVADLGKGVCDVVFLGNVVHHLDPERYAGVLERSWRALRPGGVIAIWDLAPDEAERPDLVVAGFSLLFHLTSAVPCRPSAEHAEALAAAGFQECGIRSDLSPTHVLVAARRP